MRVAKKKQISGTRDPAYLNLNDATELMMNHGTPSTEALLEIFSSPNPSFHAIARWKMSWKHTKGYVEVDSYTSAMRILRDLPEIDPLFYQYSFLPNSHVGPAIVFYKPEHEIYFKLHNNSG